MNRWDFRRKRSDCVWLLPKEGGTKSYVKYAHFLPDNLTLNANLSPEVRYRSIYRAVLYNAQISIEADFSEPLSVDGIISGGDPLWREAFLTVGVSDLKGIRSLVGSLAEDVSLAPEPGMRTGDLSGAGFTFKTPLTPGNAPGRFKFSMSLNGSDELKVAPLGRQTRMTASSSWGDPSFIGEFLPERREISDSSFNALWSVTHLNRNFPQSWAGAEPSLSRASFGVKLLLPVDEYQKNSRSVKYAIMFVALTFLTFIIIDVLNKSPFHPIHYGLIGFALILFFVILLSVSEHLSFNVSYLMAAISVVALISAYTHGVTRSARVSLVIGAVLSALYIFLFVLLQLVDYALLFGSLGLFAALALVMHLTRRIDWFVVVKPTAAVSE